MPLYCYSINKHNKNVQSKNVCGTRTISCIFFCGLKLGTSRYFSTLCRVLRQSGFGGNIRHCALMSALTRRSKYYLIYNISYNLCRVHKPCSLSFLKKTKPRWDPCGTPHVNKISYRVSIIENVSSSSY